jgi:hypothetical protein
MLFSFVQTSEAELWELIVDANIKNGVIIPGETVSITGKVVDHAYKGIRGAEVLIRTGSETTKTFTDPWGVYHGEFKDFQRVPGTYTVNVIATWYEMTGLTSTEFQVKGDASQVSILQQKLDTDDARNYLGSKESDFDKNPIGQMLFKYYHGLLDELILEQKEAVKPNVDQLFVEEQRKIAKELQNKAIEEANVGYGVYDGFQYENYIDNLNPEIKDTVINQLEFTKNLFEEAQKAKAVIMENGGTVEEARQVYLEMISVSRDTLDEFNKKNIEDESKVSEDESKVSEDESKVSEDESKVSEDE